MALDDRVGRHVTGNAGQSTDERARPDGGEMMHASPAADVGEITNMNMSGQHDLIGDDDFIADQAIVGDVTTHHQQIAVSDPGHAAKLARDGGFAKRGAVKGKGARSINPNWGAAGGEQGLQQTQSIPPFRNTSILRILPMP